MIKTPLYGHTSESTAYVVADYPYGFTLRTSIRYWLEYKAKKGYRFVSQTMNPKTGRPNKPKASTYTEFAAAMYLDENDHVQWSALGAYSSAEEVAAFVASFPGADLGAVRVLVAAKVRYLNNRISGRIVFTINGTVQPDSAVEVERMRAELVAWEAIAAAPKALAA